MPAKRQKVLKRSRMSIRKGTQSAKLSHNHATIIDLPNELLLMIFKEVHDLDLLNLALLCQRLHITALSHLLFVNYRDGRLSIADYDPWTTFAAARLALFIRSLKSLSVCINANNVQHINNLKHLILRVSSVKSVSVRISPVWLPTTSLQVIFAALQNKSCESLSVIDYYKGLFNTPPGKILPIRTLTSLTIAVNYLLSEPWIGWTIKSISASPVTELVLTCNEEILTKALPLLTLRHLTQFSLECDELSLAVLFRFLARHVKISFLRLDFRPYVDTDRSTLIETLPALTDIHCRTLTLIHLLSKATALPQLESVRIRDLMGQDFTTVTKCLQRLSRTKVSYLHTIFERCGFAAKLKNLVNPHHQLRSGRVTGAGVPVTYITITTGDFLPFDFTTELSPWLPLFPVLKTLSIEYSPSILASETEEEVAVEGLRAAFPQIEQVFINGTSKTIPRSVPGS